MRMSGLDVSLPSDIDEDINKNKKGLLPEDIEGLLPGTEEVNKEMDKEKSSIKPQNEAESDTE